MATFRRGVFLCLISPGDGVCRLYYYYVARVCSCIPAQAGVHLGFILDEFCLALSDPHGQLSVPPLLLQHGLCLSLFLSVQCQLHLKFSLEQHTFPQINNTHTQSQHLWRLPHLCLRSVPIRWKHRDMNLNGCQWGCQQ